MKRIATSLLLASAFIGFPAAAASVTFVTDTLGYGPGPAQDNFASMTATQDGGNIDFTVSAYGLNAFGPGASLASIIFVVPEGSSFGPCCSNVVGGSSVTPELGGGPDFPVASLPGMVIARLDFTQTPDLLTNGESVSFTWSGPFDVPSIVFIADVHGFDASGNPVASGYRMTTVPEPSVPFLLAAGLGVVGFLARRRA